MNHNHEYHSNKPEIKANVVYRDGNIEITLEDEFNNAPLLDTMHEKEMHFVLVSNDMEKYYHLHPQKKHEGLFIINQQLEPGTYQAFVDVTPKNHVYSVHPIELQIGDKITSTTSLNSDKNWVKVNKGVHVTLNSISAKEDEHVPLTFNTELTPQPYLGALGHVIIFMFTQNHLILQPFMLIFLKKGCIKFGQNLNLMMKCIDLLIILKLHKSISKSLKISKL